MRSYLVVAGLLVAIFGGLGLILLSKAPAGGPGSHPPAAINVVTEKALLENTQQIIQAVGTLEARQGIEITSETSGQVTQINFHSGDQVQQGQLLLVLNDKEERASRDSQRAAVKLAELQFKRDKKLLAKKSISQTTLDQSRTALDQARAQLAMTEARLANKRIKAPFSGTIGIREVDKGDYVSPGTVIASLQDLSTLKLDFTVPAQVAPLMKVGAMIHFQVSSYPGEIYLGEVTALNSRIDTNTRNLKVRAQVTGNPALLPGMFAQVQIDVGTPVARVTVPEIAINYSLHGDSVYVVEATDNGLSVRSQMVNTGEERNSRVAILSGLAEGTEIVTAGQNKLYPGAVIARTELSTPATSTTSDAH